jgi:dTDP-glucose pyrophosphorylase
MIRRVRPDKFGKIQLTDAIQFLCKEGRRVVAVQLTSSEKRYHVGTFPSYFETFVEFALADPIYGREFRKSLEHLLARTENRFWRTTIQQPSCSMVLAGQRRARAVNSPTGTSQPAS